MLPLGFLLSGSSLGDTAAVLLTIVLPFSSVPLACHCAGLLRQPALLGKQQNRGHGDLQAACLCYKWREARKRRKRE